MHAQCGFNELQYSGHTHDSAQMPAAKHHALCVYSKTECQCVTISWSVIDSVRLKVHLQLRLRCVCATPA